MSGESFLAAICDNCTETIWSSNSGKTWTHMSISDHEAAPWRFSPTEENPRRGGMGSLSGGSPVAVDQGDLPPP